VLNFRYDLNEAFSRKRSRGGGGKYRHIRVVDKIDKVKNVRSILVECPLEYPGLTEQERRRMYEGLAMVADAYRDADARCERESRKTRGVSR
jgi:hypothetical protein